MGNGGEVNLWEKAGGGDRLREGDRGGTVVGCNI